MATLTKKDLLEAIKDMPMDAKITFAARNYETQSLDYFRTCKVERLPYGYFIILEDNFL